MLIASELMTGGSLHTLIGDFGPLAESTVITVLRQVLSGLQAVHDAELIHRDVKPANLLLRATGDGPLHVVLTDFGLTISRLDARLTQVGMVIGTPGYVPPEVLKGGVPPDPRHDLYAVGRLALTMIAGEEPTGDTAELVSAIAGSSAAGDGARRCSGTTRSERPADAAAAAAMLNRNGQLRADRTTAYPRRRPDRGSRPACPCCRPGWGPDGPLDALAAELDRPAPRATDRGRGTHRARVRFRSRSDRDRAARSGAVAADAGSVTTAGAESTAGRTTVDPSTRADPDRCCRGRDVGGRIRTGGVAAAGRHHREPVQPTGAPPRPRPTRPRPPRRRRTRPERQPVEQHPAHPASSRLPPPPSHRRTSAPGIPAPGSRRETGAPASTGSRLACTLADGSYQWRTPG